MEFQFIIKKWANFYFFLQNLSEWHFSNRKRYNIFWKRELGPFSKKEKEALKKFKKIHLKYGFGSRQSYLGSYFYLRKSPWKTLEEQLVRREAIILQEIFLIFQPKFNILWRKERPLLEKWKRKLQKEANKKSLIDPINDALCHFYHKTSPPNRIRVYLLLSPVGIGGTANPGNYAITLEISRYPLEKINEALALAWHEVIHICYEKQYFLSLLNKKFPKPKDRKLKNLIQETTARAFFPYGLLGERFLKLQKDTAIPKSFFQLIEKYLALGKACDPDFITRASAVL